MMRLGLSAVILLVYAVVSAQAFGLCEQYGEVSGRSPGAGVLYRKVERKLHQQDKDEQGLREVEQLAGEAAPTLQNAAHGPEFLRDAFSALFGVELVAQKPDMIQGMKSAIQLAQIGAGQIVEQMPNDVWATHNTVNGILGFSRLFDPEGTSAQTNMATFKEAVDIYKPDTTYNRYEGPGEGTTPAVDEPLQAELQIRFGQMALYFKKSPKDLLALRDQASSALSAVPAHRQREDAVLNLLSEHLESGRSLPELAKDLEKLGKQLEEKEFYFSQDEAFWALRIARSRGVSPLKAAMLMQELTYADISKRYNPQRVSYGTYGGGGSLPSQTFHYQGGTKENYLFGLLADTNMQPEAIVQQARNAMNVAINERTDYGGSDRAAGAMARLWLERTGYSPATRYLVSQAMAGSRTQ